MKLLAILYMFLAFGCTCKKPELKPVTKDSASTVPTVKENIIDTPVYVIAPKPVQPKCDSLIAVIDSFNSMLSVSNMRVAKVRYYLAKANKSPNTYRNILADSLTYAVNLTKVNVVPQNTNRDCIALKATRDSLRIELTRANFKVIRVKYYTGLAVSRPQKFNVFLRGWINGLFENQ